MGILDALFGKMDALQPLDPASEAASRIGARIAELEPFLRKVHLAVELVPAADAVYAYIGKPPGDFGMAWFEDGREESFTTLKERHGISQGRVQVLAAKLGAAYRKSADAARYGATIAGKEVVVTPSDALAAEIRRVIGEAVS